MDFPQTIETAGRVITKCKYSAPGSSRFAAEWLSFVLF
jgi:hypothetical protein